jgi:hypothetical protein
MNNKENNILSEQFQNQKCQIRRKWHDQCPYKHTTHDQCPY